MQGNDRRKAVSPEGISIPATTIDGRSVGAPVAGGKRAETIRRNPPVSYPANNLLDRRADFLTGQTAPTRGYLRGTGEEAQRRPVRKDASHRVSYW